LKKRVSYIYPYSFHYRYPFNLKLKEILEGHGIEYKVVYADLFGAGLSKKDTVEIPWGQKVPLWHSKSEKIIFQSAFRDIFASDLVIIQQENRLLINYFCQILSLLRLKRVAFFGHGRNYQAPNPNSRSERFKAFWATKVDWWFAYTEGTKRHVASLGFPVERITVFNNAIDTDELATQLASVTASDKKQLKKSLGNTSDNIGVYIGGLYPEKRVDFMLAAAVEIRKSIPDFQFLVIGGGVDAELVQQAAKHHSWIHALGPKFGIEKTKLASLAKVFIMPGLVGLGVLDSFVYGTPLVTTDFPLHSPEIEYLEDGVNGVMVKEVDSVEAYAKAVVRVLIDKDYFDALKAGAAKSLKIYTIDAMAERFAKGVLSALKL
jgi:glycosyltransferase involved in cell wall biosynthesis